MIYSQIVKSIAGVVICYAGPRLISYSYRNRELFLAEATRTKIQNAYNQFTKLPKVIPKFCQNTANYLDNNRNQVISIHALLLLLHLTQATNLDSGDYWSIHVLLLPSFWQDMATLANKTPRLFQYTTEVIHDNQWICHLAFCYLFFNGQIVYKTTNDLIWQYGKVAIIGNLGIDILKSIIANWIIPETYKSYFANRLDQYV